MTTLQFISSLCVVFLVGCAITACKETQACQVTIDANQPVMLKAGECATFDRKLMIAFDSVAEDSRCPPDVQCVWMGNAKVALRWWTDGATPSRFYLNTHPDFTNDTLIAGYTISLLDLQPQRLSTQDPTTVVYRVQLVAKR